MINVKFLGTSGSVPTKSRNLPSVAITCEGKTLLFDCGEGAQRQAMRYGVNLSNVSAIFITHMHVDHVLGVAGLIRTLALNRRSEPLYIFLPKDGENGIRALLNFDKALISYPIIVKQAKAGTIFESKDFSVKAIRLNHTVP
ncbi:MAG: MBL fold metallo-hydrolase, partial [Candidatus Micrarchaeia archaeon]